MPSKSNKCQKVYPGLVLHAGPPSYRQGTWYVWYTLPNSPLSIARQQWYRPVGIGSVEGLFDVYAQAQSYFEAANAGKDAAAVLVAIDGLYSPDPSGRWSATVMKTFTHFDKPTFDQLMEFGRDPITDRVAADIETFARVLNPL